jgi:hypothetical protein
VIQVEGQGRGKEAEAILEQGLRRAGGTAAQPGTTG